MRALVRNQLTGRVLPCCWDTCESPGDNQVRVEVPHDAPRWPGEKLVYIFCSERHQGYWLNSTFSRGNLPTGSKRLSGPTACR